MRRRDVIDVRTFTTPREERLAVIRAIADANLLTVDDLLGRSRAKHICAARKAAMRAVRERFPRDSVPMLGRLFDRDHTTILHALKH